MAERILRNAVAGVAAARDEMEELFLGGYGAKTKLGIEMRGGPVVAPIPGEPAFKTPEERRAAVKARKEAADAAEKAAKQAAKDKEKIDAFWQGVSEEIGAWLEGGRVAQKAARDKQVGEARAARLKQQGEIAGQIEKGPVMARAEAAAAQAQAMGGGAGQMRAAAIAELQPLLNQLMPGRGRGGERAAVGEQILGKIQADLDQRMMDIVAANIATGGQQLSNVQRLMAVADGLMAQVDAQRAAAQAQGEMIGPMNGQGNARVGAGRNRGR
jgi:hypothetical protein